MTHVVLAPCANAASIAHFNDTVARPVDLRTVEHFLPALDLTAIRAAHPGGRAAMWGVMPGSNSRQVAKWARIEAEDQVVFSRSGARGQPGGLFARAAVTHTMRVPALARHLWGSDGNHTWEWMFALDDPVDIDVPYSAMNPIIGWSPTAHVQEFNVLDEARSALLLPLVLDDTTTDQSPSPLSPPPVRGPEEIPVESQNVESYERQRRGEQQPQSLRREARLVSAYVEWLASRGQSTCRHRVPIPEGGDLYTDVFNKDTEELVEAKASSGRVAVRTGLGQILDYARLVPHTDRALLLPSRPSKDLVELLHQYRVNVIWQANSGFDRTDHAP